MLLPGWDFIWIEGQHGRQTFSSTDMGKSAGLVAHDVDGVRRARRLGYQVIVGGSAAAFLRALAARLELLCLEAERPAG